MLPVIMRVSLSEIHSSGFRRKPTFRYAASGLYNPEVAEVGLTESEVINYKGEISKWNFDENDRARAEREIEGLVKVVVSRRGKILGAGIAGKNAGDLITPWTLAMQEELNISSMVNLISAYPTRSEASKRAAGSFILQFCMEKPQKASEIFKLFG